MSTLGWVMGAYCASYGALMFVAPHRFASPVYAMLIPHLTWWGGAYLLAGTALLAASAFTTPRAFRVAACQAVGLLLFVTAFGLMTAGAPSGALLYLLLATGTMLIPFLPEQDAAPADLFVVLFGLGVALGGMLMLTQPAQFNLHIYDLIRPHLTWYGLALLGSGLALLASQLLPLSKLLLLLAHLWAGVTFLALLLRVVFPYAALSGLALYGGLGLVVVLLPLLGPRLRRIDRASLRTRLALVFSAAAALPVIATVGLYGNQVECEVTRDVLAGQAALARALAAGASEDGGAPPDLAAFLERATGEAPLAAYLVDGQGQLVAQAGAAVGRTPTAHAPAESLARLFGDGDAGSLAYRERGAGYLAGYARVPGSTLGVVVESASADVLATIHAIRDLAFGLLLAFMGVAAAGGVASARWLSAPLGSLSQAVRQVGDGATAPLIPNSSVTEVDHLARVFDEMRDRLAAREQERDRAEAERADLLQAVDGERATLAEVIANLNDGLVLWGKRGYVRYVNTRGRELLGDDPPGVHGMSHAEIVALICELVGDPAAARQTFNRLPLGFEEPSISFEACAAGPPRRELLCQLFRIPRPHGWGWALALRDVTALRQVALLEERERIAMELHDGAIQSLYAVTLWLAARERGLDDPDHTRRVLRQSMAQIDGVIQELRDYVASLRSMEAANQSLSNGLARLVEGLRQGGAISPRLETELHVDRGLGQVAMHHLLAIAREAASNAVRHAQAHEVVISARRVGDCLELAIRDDGRGFYPDETAPGEGHGLRNIAARACRLGAELAIASSPDRGTEIRLTVPLEESAQHATIADQAARRR